MKTFLVSIFLIVLSIYQPSFAQVDIKTIASDTLFLNYTKTKKLSRATNAETVFIRIIKPANEDYKSFEDYYVVDNDSYLQAKGILNLQNWEEDSLLTFYKIGNKL